jgi:probable rRNA maturation factor
VQENLLITNKTKERDMLINMSLFLRIKDDILGKKYTLSVAYVGEKKSKEINFKYRNKNKSTNVLSFSYSKNEGEIILCPQIIKRQAKNFDKTPKNFLGFLVIHGMLHLKGMEHGSIMEKEEKKYDKKYFSSNRHRLEQNKSRNS